MIVPSVLARKHENVKPYLEVVEGFVKDRLRGYADCNEYAFVGRMKKTDSLVEKIETGRFSSWSSLDDLYACCVIVPTLSHESGVLEYLKKNFLAVDVKSRGLTQKDPAVFRFDATRFIGRVSSDHLPVASREILGTQFEVQIRTAFEHAWSTTTHALAYKGGRVDWRRLRLAAQLKASVEQLDALVSGYDDISGKIFSQKWPEVEAKRAVEVFFLARFHNGELPVELEPLSWLRFCENFFSLVLAAKDRYVDDKVGAVNEALTLVSDEISSVDQKQVPRSLSLLQLCIGILSKRGAISKPLRRYVPLVTRELIDFYPQASVLGQGFVVD